MTRYNFDSNFLLKNKITGRSYINDLAHRKIWVRDGVENKVALANFCISDLTWNESSKDIDTVVLLGDSSTSYTLPSNQAALKNRVYRDCRPVGGMVVGESVVKKYNHFAVNDYLYEFILLLVRGIQNGTLPTGQEKVTLSLSYGDNSTHKNGVITILAKDEDNNPISGLTISGTAGSIPISGTTDANGKVEKTISTAGTYAVTVNSAETSSYYPATQTGSVTVTEKETITLNISSEDTSTLQNGTLIITAKDSTNNPVSGLTVSGTAGSVTISGTTDANGEVSTSLTSEGTYDVNVESEGTDDYKAATAEAEITVTIIVPKTEVEIGTTRDFDNPIVSFYVVPVGGDDPINGIRIVGTVGDIPVDGVTEDNLLAVTVPSFGTYAVDVHSVATSEYASATFTGEVIV